MKNPRKPLKTLRDDESGAVLIWVSVMIVVIFGFVALALDGSRYLGLNSNMQQIADAAALAGAKQLDGSASAISNAKKAAKDYLKNAAQWSDIANTGTTEIDEAQILFYSAPPKDDGTSVPLSDNKIGNQTAAYIKVTTVQRGLSTSFARAVSNGDAYTQASAVAHVVYSVCRPVQSFLCNPWESKQDPSQFGTASSFGGTNVKAGDLFLLTSGTGASPGNWGFIDPTSDGKGSSSKLELQNYWAAQGASSCQNIDVGQLGPWPDTGKDTGQKSVDGMNVRFDVPNTTNGAVANIRAPIVTDGFVIAAGSSGNASCQSTTSATPTYTEQKSVTSGKKTVINATTCKFEQVTTGASTRYRDYCNARLASNTLVSKPCTGKSCDTEVTSCASFTTGDYRIGSCPFPRDPDMSADSPSWQGVTKGKGANPDDLKAYWANHHTTLYPSGVTTRYELYKKEVEQLGQSGYFNTLGWQANSVEPTSSGNACTKSAVGTIERRLINVAIVDCDYWAMNGKKNRLPVLTKNAVFFMTEPAVAAYNSTASPSEYGKIYGEFVGAYSVNQDGGSIFQQVELVK